MPKVIKIIEDQIEVVIQDIETFAKQVAQRLGLEHETVLTAIHETTDAAKAVNQGEAANTGETGAGESQSEANPSTIPSGAQENTTIPSGVQNQKNNTPSGSGTDTGVGNGTV